MGYCEFEDFIPEQIYGKKIAVAYGNCHAEIVRQYLGRNRDFSKEYGFYPFPMIQAMKDDFDYEQILSHCNLFIDQAIRDANRYGKKYASSALSDCLSQTCLRVCIPNLYGLPRCFFPQLGGGGTGFLPSGEVNIMKWYREGWTKEEMMDKMLEGGIYSEEYIISLWEEFREKLLIREREWDIKISDYIFEHYKTKKLFTNPNHITSELAREISIRTLKYLGYKAEYPYIIPAMDDLEVFIYKDVKKALGLEYDEIYIRNYARYLLMEERDVDIEEYINQCYQSCAFYLSTQNGATDLNV